MCNLYLLVTFDSYRILEMKIFGNITSIKITLKWKIKQLFLFHKLWLHCLIKVSFHDKGIFLLSYLYNLIFCTQLQVYSICVILLTHYYLTIDK